jgi:hypothetical protein
MLVDRWTRRTVKQMRENNDLLECCECGGLYMFGYLDPFNIFICNDCYEG